MGGVEEEPSLSPPPPPRKNTEAGRLPVPARGRRGRTRTLTGLANGAQGQDQTGVTPHPYPFSPEDGEDDGVRLDLPARHGGALWPPPGHCPLLPLGGRRSSLARDSTTGSGRLKRLRKPRRRAPSPSRRHPCPPIRRFPQHGRHGPRGNLRRRGGAGAGVPPFSSDFPALAGRSSKVQRNGRKRRSCSPD